MREYATLTTKRKPLKNINYSLGKHCDCVSLSCEEKMTKLVVYCVALIPSMIVTMTNKLTIRPARLCCRLRMFGLDYCYRHDVM